MAKLNAQERQAKVSVVMAAVGGLFAIAGTIFVLQALNFEHFEVRYNPNGLRLPIVVISIGLAGLAGTIGLFAGLSSAGHKRNKLSRLSWAGFFSSAVVLTLAMSVFVFFWMAKEAIAFPG